MGFLNHLDTSSGQFTTTCLEIAQHKSWFQWKKTHKLRRSLVGGPKTALSLPNKKAIQFSLFFFTGRKQNLVQNFGNGPGRFLEGATPFEWVLTGTMFANFPKSYC